MDVSDIFYFFCSGEGKGKSGATGSGEGVGFFSLKTQGGGGGVLSKGGVSLREGGREGAERGCAANLGGGG